MAVHSSNSCTNMAADFEDSLSVASSSPNLQSGESCVISGLNKAFIDPVERAAAQFEAMAIMPDDEIDRPTSSMSMDTGARRKSCVSLRSKRRFKCFRQRRFQSWLPAHVLRGDFVWQALHTAVTTNNIERAERLLEAGVHPDFMSSGFPLHFAACRGFTEMVALLLKHGACPSGRNNEKQTPLHMAVKSYRSSIVSLLLNAGADPSLTDLTSRNPLNCAESMLTNLPITSEDSVLGLKDELKKIVMLLASALEMQNWRSRTN